MFAWLITICILLNQSQSDVPPPDLTDNVLDFELPDLDGNVVSSSDVRFKDKVLLVDLWGTWCPPCRKAVPFLVKLQDRYKKDGLRIVGIAFEFAASEESRRERIQKFAEEMDINYLLLDGGGDPDAELRNALPDIEANHAFPTMFIIGRDGTVQYSKSGFDPKDEARIEAELKKILAN